LTSIFFTVLEQIAGQGSRTSASLKWAEEKIRRARYGNLGFSSTTLCLYFKEIVECLRPWTFCQIQYNYMDTSFQAGTEGLKYAAKKGLAVR